MNIPQLGLEILFASSLVSFYNPQRKKEVLIVITNHCSNADSGGQSNVRTTQFD